MMNAPARLLPIASLLVLLPGVGAAQALHRLTPYQQQPGEVMHIVTKSSSANGTVTITEGGADQKGKVTYERDRNIERRVGVSDGRPMIDYKVVSDLTKTSVELGGTTNPQTIVSSLSGMSVIGTRDGVGAWRFAIPDREPTLDQAEELAQIESYENHHLMPQEPVRLKQSWKIEPAFLRHLTERGIGFASIEANARLDQIKDMDGEPTAIITFTVETVATEGTSFDKRGSGATIKAAGEIHVSMKTMLDKRLVLYGSRTTVTVEDGVRTKTVLPIKIEMTKTIQR